MNYTHDLIVIGCGPAGMSAAITATAAGLRTIVLDEQPRPGGQIYRNVTAAAPTIARLLGTDYQYGRSLAERFAQSGAEVFHSTLVWDVAKDLTVTCDRAGRSFQVRAPQLIAASGAIERASPVPGWTLPGVLNAGAAQIALKSAAIVPAGPVILAGGGPLLLLVACQLIDAGASIAAVVETSPAANRLSALSHLPRALGATKMLLKGLSMLRKLRKAGVPMYAEARDLRVEGHERASGLSFTVRGVLRHIEANAVLLHHGVVPNTQISRLLRVDHDWNETQLAWQPRTDEFGETSLAGFRIAGDGANIAGALAAEARGALVALGAAFALGKVEANQRDTLAEPWRRRHAQQLRIRTFLDTLYRPPEWVSNPSDETIVCRCEEVTAGKVREMAALGCLGPNQTKFFSRCGMGPCQGRTCGVAVTQILARALNKTPDEVGAYRVRAPLKPIPLASIAKLAVAQDANQNPIGLVK